MLAELGEFQHRSVSSFIRELVDAATPLLRATLPILRARAAAIEQQPEALENAAREALGALFGDDGAQMDLVDHIASLMAPGGPVRGGDDRPDRGAEPRERTDGSAPIVPPACNYGGQV